MDDEGEYERSLENASAELAQFILYMQNQKKGCIKENDMRKILAGIPSAGGKREQCIDRTIDFLDKVVGVKVYKTHTLQGFRLHIGNALQKNNEACFATETSYSDGDRAKLGLLIAVLMFIYMMRRPNSLNSFITQSLLQNFLDQMGLTKNGCFGTQMDLNKLLGATPTAEFISQGWLSYTKNTDEFGNERINYEWGPRAKAFIEPSKIDYLLMMYWPQRFDLPATSMENRPMKLRMIKLFLSLCSNNSN